MPVDIKLVVIMTITTLTQVDTVPGLKAERSLEDMLETQEDLIKTVKYSVKATQD